MIIKKIISGGQTGGDRAALDWAIQNGIPHGGWCPQGRKAEDGIISRCYNLQETPSTDYAQRTAWNVRDSEGTLIFSLRKDLVGGSLLTKEFAQEYQKPYLHLAQENYSDQQIITLTEFLENNYIKILNIAGSRASEEAKIYNFVMEVLQRI